ncbi:MAG: hypothetical protein E4G95_05205 [Bacteroidia bacterium]|nr:MAG: hypothetical protein E4G95_05205 [Bacteroidia bacterium]
MSIHNSILLTLSNYSCTAALHPAFSWLPGWEINPAFAGSMAIVKSLLKWLVYYLSATILQTPGTILTSLKVSFSKELKIIFFGTM